MSSRVALVALLGLALALRIPLLDADLYFDEAWYFYLARTLGLVPLSAPLETLAEPWLHFCARPLTYLFFWPAAQVSLLACRLLNVVLGLLLVGLVVGTCRLWGLSRPLAGFAGLLCALNPALIIWSQYLFPDTLGAVLGLLALAALLRERLGWCALCLAMAVLVKEVFLALALAAFLAGPARLRAWLVVAMVPYGVLFAYVFVLNGMRLQGWAGAPPLNYQFWKCAGCDGIAVVLVLALLATPRWRVAVWALACPVLYLVRELWFGPGVQLWYAVAVRPFMAVALAGGLARLERRRVLLVGLALFSLLSSLWFSWPDMDRALTVRHELRDVCAQIRALKPRQLLLVGLPWQAPAWPFSELAPQVRGCAWDTRALQALVPRSEYILVERPPGPRRYVPFESLVELIYLNPTFQLYRVRP